MTEPIVNPKIAEIHRLYREGKNDEADRLYEAWRSDIKASLDALDEGQGRMQVKVLAVTAGQPKPSMASVYRELIIDYRTSIRLAKEISTMKKVLRDYKKARKAP